jgi:hypothetical protein
MACHGGGRGGNGVSLLILIVIHIVGWFVSVFVTHKHRGGQQLCQFWLPHRTPCALCGGVEENTDSLVKGIRQSVVRLYFVVVAQRIFFLYFRGLKNWREIHLLGPLLML